MTVTEVLALLAIGTAGGIVSTVASIASVVSYPALLALGLPPLSANMTNTFALLFTGAGAAAGSRPELAGQGTRIRRLGPVAAVGGGAGAALLLVTPATAFERAAPVLIGVASLLLLAPFLPRRASGQRAQARPGDWEQPGDPVQPGPGPPGPGPPGPGQPGGSGQPGGRPGGSGARPHRRGLVAALFLVMMYVGYFGAAGGVLVLAVLSAMLTEPITRSNALKNVLSGLANTVAAVAFALLGHVDWAVVPPLAAGFLAGGWSGPALVRRLPAGVLRAGVSVCGLAVAAKLGLSAYG